MNIPDPPDPNDLTPEDIAWNNFENTLTQAIDNFFKENPGQENSISHMFCTLFFCLTESKHGISDYECLGHLENAKTIINHTMIAQREFDNNDDLGPEFGDGIGDEFHGGI